MIIIIPFVIRLLVSNLTLGGALLISGFYRKHLISEMVYIEGGINIIILVLIVLSLLLQFLIQSNFFIIYFLIEG